MATKSCRQFAAAEARPVADCELFSGSANGSDFANLKCLRCTSGKILKLNPAPACVLRSSLQLPAEFNSCVQLEHVTSADPTPIQTFTCKACQGGIYISSKDSSTNPLFKYFGCKATATDAYPMQDFCELTGISECFTCSNSYQRAVDGSCQP